MKNKSNIIILLFFILTTTVSAQKGYKIINKAEKKYENNKFKKSLSLLDKAQEIDYGFCGNAWDSAEKRIYLLKSKIYLQTKEFQLARNSIDSIYSESNSHRLDSLKIKTYQLEYGADSLRNLIDTSLSNSKIKCLNNCFVILPLSNGKEIKFNLITNNTTSLIFEENKKVQITKWISVFKKSKNYLMLVNKK